MLMHFCWKDRSSTSSTPEDDLVIFPEEIEFKKVTQTSTGTSTDQWRFSDSLFNQQKCLLGRIYLLKWRSNARKLFFWMQEPKEDKDDEFCKKVNNLVRLNSTTIPPLMHYSISSIIRRRLALLMRAVATMLLTFCNH